MIAIPNKELPTLPLTPEVLGDVQYTHEQIAAVVFNVPMAQVNDAQRRWVKTMRFGFLYTPRTPPFTFPKRATK